MDPLEARMLLRTFVRDRGIVKHSIMVSYVMRLIGERLKDDPNKWEICGLLHDLDLPQVILNYEMHGKISAQILKGEDVEDDIIEAIYFHERERKDKNPMEAALSIIETITKEMKPSELAETESLPEGAKGLLKFIGMVEEEFVDIFKRGVMMFIEEFYRKGGNDEI